MRPNKDADVSDISFSDIYVTNAGFTGSYICGYKDRPIKNLTFKNVYIETEGGGTNNMAEFEMRGLVAGAWSLVPAYGLYCQEIDNLVVDNVKLVTKKKEMRSAFHAENINGLEMYRFQTQQAPGAEPPVKLVNVTNLSVGSSFVSEMENNKVSVKNIALNNNWSENENEFVEDETINAELTVEANSVGLTKLEIEIAGNNYHRWTYLEKGISSVVKFEIPALPAGNYELKATNNSKEFTVIEHPAQAAFKVLGFSMHHKNSDNYKKFSKAIYEYLIDIREDGSFLLNMDYFDFATGLRMYKRQKWEQLFGFSPLKADEKQGQNQADLALAIQHVIEDVILKLAKTTRDITGKENIVLAGGVALNSVANGKLRKSGLFKNQWIVPAAGDAGGALGAALAVFHIVKEKSRILMVPDAMNNSALGPAFSKHNVEAVLKRYGAVYQKFDCQSDRFYETIARLIQTEKVVGWFQGRMEFGPRALGYRSILADARSTKMQKVLNLKIKKREGFRPFAPIVLEEDAQLHFETDFETPYMLHVVPVKKEVAGDWPADFSTKTMEEKLAYPKGKLPAITHVDGSARVQTVSEKRNPKLHRLLKEFKKQTGTGVLINTSFNERGEPIVCTADNAFRSFMRTEMDVLVLEDFILLKAEQDIDIKQFENEFKPD